MRGFKLLRRELLVEISTRCSLSMCKEVEIFQGINRYAKETVAPIYATWIDRYRE